MAKQHGHSIATMLRARATWTEETGEVNGEAIPEFERGPGGRAVEGLEPSNSGIKPAISINLINKLRKLLRCLSPPLLLFPQPCHYRPLRLSDETSKNRLDPAATQSTTGPQIQVAGGVCRAR